MLIMFTDSVEFLVKCFDGLEEIVITSESFNTLILLLSLNLKKKLGHYNVFYLRDCTYTIVALGFVY